MRDFFVSEGSFSSRKMFGFSCLHGYSNGNNIGKKGYQFPMDPFCFISVTQKILELFIKYVLCLLAFSINCIIVKIFLSYL